MTSRTKLVLVAAVSAFSALSWAQVSGPAPLSWKWQQSTSVVPGPIKVDGDTVYSAVGRRVYALDRLTGNQKWRFPMGEGLQANLITGVVVNQGVAVFAADNRMLYGVDANTGEKKWEKVLETNVYGRPVVSGKFVLIAEGTSSVLAINPINGEPAWAEPVKLPYPMLSPVVASENDFFAISDNSELTCYTSLTGKQRWKVRLAQLRFGVEPVFSEDTIYLFSGEYVLGLATQNGARRMQANAGANLLFSPAIYKDIVTVVTDDARLLSFNRSGRAIAAPLPLGSQAMNAPVYVGGRVIVNTVNGNMNMIDPFTAQFVWNYTLKPTVKPKANDKGVTPPNLMVASTPVVASGSTLILAGQDGQLLAFDPNTGVDLTGPEAKMTFPPNGAEMYGQSNVAQDQIQPFFLFDVSDEACGLKGDTVKVEIDGRQMVHQMTKDGQYAVVIDGRQNRGFSDGNKKIIVTSTDWLGNVSKHEFFVTIDNAIPPFKRAASGGSNSGGFGGGRDN